MLEVSFLAIFMTGFLGGVHCLGMCGGLSSAFVFQIPQNLSRIRLILFLNFGRITTYTFLGLVVGAISQFGSFIDHTKTVQTVFYVFAQVMVILMGLYLAGISNWLLKFERLGSPVWKNFFSKKLGRFLPIKSYRGAYVAGLIWGWIPCGLIYSSSAQAMASHSALVGAALMLVFGLSTLPNLLLMNIFTSELKNFFTNKSVRLIVGLILALMGVLQILFIFGYIPKSFYFF